MTDREALIALLTEQEGDRLKAYDDATGKELRPGDTLRGNLTIGRGHNLTALGIPQAVSDLLANGDADDVEADLVSFPWFVTLNTVRQRAVTSMRFNLGPLGFRGFREFIHDMAIGDFDGAANELVNSRAATQAPSRYRALAAMIRTGTE